MPSVADFLVSLLADPQTPLRVLLAFHIPAGLTCVITGAVAMLSQKRRGRHPRFGQIYYKALAVVFVSAVGLAALRWPDDAYLLALGALAFALASLGYIARRIRWRGWTSAHIFGMGLSYVVMHTAFWVDNGPTLPLWNRLPVLAFWIAPSLIALPFFVLAFRHHTNVSNDLRSTARQLVSISRP